MLIWENTYLTNQTCSACSCNTCIYIYFKNEEKYLQNQDRPHKDTCTHASFNSHNHKVYFLQDPTDTHTKSHTARTDRQDPLT